MNKLFLFSLMLVSLVTCKAQTVIDNFIIGPYIVDYLGDGDVKYRLKDNINLYDFYELKRDTTIISAIKEVPIQQAFEIAFNGGTNRFSSKEIGVEGVWKKMVGNNRYFNCGLSVEFGITNMGKKQLKRTMLEIGVPVAIEFGKLNRQSAGLYGSFGITPAFYSTMHLENQKVAEDINPEKSGFMVVPTAEFGGNIPVGGTIVRIGVYARYKINCTVGDFDVFKAGCAGRAFAGAKIGFVL